MRYRKKPVEIEAVQWTGENRQEIFEFLAGPRPATTETYESNCYIDHSRVEGGLVIITLEGEHVASIGDYIIRGVQGEYYPCKPDIFQQTYDVVNGD